MFNPLNYIKETKAELKHVSWPTRKQTIQFTVLVLVLSILVAYYLGFFDIIFNFLLRSVI